ncbi:MAG: hypothetical protein H7836_05210 [Magnetococcus sp. YQC-3]
MRSIRHFWLSNFMEAEQKLWMAVLENALNDALSCHDRVEQIRARRWFQDAGAGFQLVCDLANFDPCYVRRKVLSMIEKESVVN